MAAATATVTTAVVDLAGKPLQGWIGCAHAMMPGQRTALGGEARRAGGRVLRGRGWRQLALVEEARRHAPCDDRRLLEQPALVIGSKAADVDHVLADAGLDVDDSAIDHVVAAGGGSVRDTLSALDRVVAAAEGAAGIGAFLVDLLGFLLLFLLLPGFSLPGLFSGLLFKMPIRFPTGIFDHAVIFLPALLGTDLIVLDFIDRLYILRVFGWLGIGVAFDAVGIRPGVDAIC